MHELVIKGNRAASTRPPKPEAGAHFPPLRPGQVRELDRGGSM